MKKLIIKTSIITVLSVLVAAILLVTTLCIFAPKTVSDYFYSVGNGNLSVSYMEKAYNKNKSADNLEELIFKANENEDYSRVVKYSEIFINREDFTSYANNKPSVAGQMTYEEYVYGNYVIALYNTGATKEVIFAVADKTVESEYSEYSAYSSLIYGVDITDVEFLTVLSDKLLDLKTNYPENDNLDADITCVSQMITNLKGES